MRPFWGILLWVAAGLAVIWVGLPLTARPGEHVESRAATSSREEGVRELAEEFDPLNLGVNDRIAYLTSRGVYSCAVLCHDKLKPNPVRREVVATHEHVRLNHGEFMWCLECHSADNRDRLRLINGAEVDFNESYRLCGQCHGPVYRDWKHGVHGMLSGGWNREQRAWPCVRCHQPHDPAFKPMVPRPPPRTRWEHPDEAKRAVERGQERED